jgi:anti-sigma regulatory factor (Ser/Thr protein kinase)
MALDGGDTERGDAEPGPELKEFTTIGFHEFLPTNHAVVAARRFVHQTLAAQGATADTIAAAELVADEFALNAVRHAGTFFSVAVETASGAVRIAVRDDAGAYPELHDHALESIGGRGLSIVAMTAEQWGAESLGRGKEVWAEIR